MFHFLFALDSNCFEDVKCVIQYYRLCATFRATLLLFDKELTTQRKRNDWLTSQISLASYRTSIQLDQSDKSQI